MESEPILNDPIHAKLLALKPINGTVWDVVVVGGGTAGVMAAVQAGRAGARTLLLEKNGVLGGTITVAGVSYPGLFHAWGKQVIAGIGWELVNRCVAECGLPLPDFTEKDAPHWRQQIRLNAAVYAALCDEAVLDAGVVPLLHAMPAAVEKNERGWKFAFVSKSGLRTIECGILVDCTGDADVVALAGGKRIVPAEVQPGTLVCRAAGYDLAQLDMKMLNQRFREAAARGELLATDACWNAQAPDLQWVRQFGGNSGHIRGTGAHDGEGRTRMEIEARRALLRLTRFLRRQPGLEKLRVEWLSGECGVRETATIEGESAVTLSDYVSGKVWEDAVCFSFYPIDLHLYSKNGLDYRKLPEGVVPTIPRSALIPRGFDSLLAAGRCVASDRLANSALRVQATCMATGQAAGAIAALAAKNRTPVGAVPLDQLRRLLREHGALVPEIG